MFDTVWDGYDSIPGLLMTIAAFLMLQRAWRIRSALIASLGASTLGIYFVHVPIMMALDRYYLAVNSAILGASPRKGLTLAARFGRNRPMLSLDDLFGFLPIDRTRCRPAGQCAGLSPSM